MLVSLAVQILTNVEALNMVESIGNYTRHRRAPAIFEKDGKLIIRYVPAVSGESIAHAYQEILAEVAEKRGIKVCERCRRGELTKHADEAMFAKEPWEERFVDLVKSKEFDGAEKLVIENCAVEDVGGFLYAGRQVPIKRTSRIQFGYMLPVLEALKEGGAAIEPQFHARHVPTMPERRAQMIYYVETGSAFYTYSAAIDVEGIGRTSFVKREEVEDREKRVKAALEALTIHTCNALFGAKRSRFTPAWKVVSLAAAISDPLAFLVSPAHASRHIEDTCRRAAKYKEVLKDLGEEVQVFYFAEEGFKPGKGEAAGAEECSSPEEVMEKLIHRVVKS